MYRLFLSTLLSTFFICGAYPTTAMADGLVSSPGFETLHLGGGLIIGDSETKSLSLGGPRYIKNLVIQAQGTSRDSTVEIMVNGQIKGTLYAPGQDPSFVVTIAETARSIEFRYRAGGAMRILDVVGTVSSWIGHPGDHGGGFSGSKDQVLQLALAALREIEVLKTFATPDEDRTYLFPIKKNAGLVYVMANAHGELSRRTITQLVALSDQIDFAHPYLNQLMQQDGAFDAVVDILTVRESINALLD